MQCSVKLGRDQNRGNKMKTINGYKNPYRKETNLDTIVDQLCIRLQDIKDQEDSAEHIGMPTCNLEHTEAVRRYYAAFPALTKGKESPLQYYLPPPAWCRKTAPDNTIKMQSELSTQKDWNKTKKFSGKERRNSYHGSRKNRKRYNSYSRSFDSKESLPEWMTHEGVWDMEAQDPVKEFIRAIALDEGYGTCENTVTDEIKEITQVEIKMADNLVPDWDDSLDLESDWIITEDLIPRERTPMEEELYAKFEAKFDHSIEALWAKNQDTPDDEYQELPIDFQDLLSSPSDRLFGAPFVAQGSFVSLESVPTAEGDAAALAEVLRARFQPLRLDEPPPRARQAESVALREGLDIYDAVSTVADTMRSFTALNHSRDRSGFVEVPPRSALGTRPPPVRQAPAPPPPPPPPRDDPLTSNRTHFRPIKRDFEAERAGRYFDGDTFDIRGDLDSVEFRRSDSGGVYLAGSLDRYLEYRAEKTIDYGRLNLTEAQRCPDLDDPGLRLRFPVRQHDAAVQTDRAPAAWPPCDACGHAAAKKMRPSAIESIWSAADACAACPGTAAAPPAQPAPDELSREWEELLQDISAAHAEYLRADVVEDTLVSAERKRRHSAALRGPPAPPPACSHPHARFLHCALALAADRPLTR